MANVFSKENRQQLSAATIKEYPLPYDPNTIVRVKQQSMARMNRYSEASKAGGNRAAKETYSLIADSIVDEDGDVIWERNEISVIEQANCRLVSALVKMIGDCNGGGDDDIEAMLGNLEQTE